MEWKTRYERFQYIKQTIKEAQDYLVIGVDVGKDTHHACTMLSREIGDTKHNSK